MIANIISYIRIKNIGKQIKRDYLNSFELLNIFTHISERLGVFYDTVDQTGTPFLRLNKSIAPIRSVLCD